MKTFNDLTVDCLFVLFKQFSVEELIELRKVCQLWAFIAESYQLKKSLKIFGSLEHVAKYSQFLLDHKLYLHECLLLKPIGIADELVDLNENILANLNPKVQHLVYNDSPDKLDSVLQAMPFISNLVLFLFKEKYNNFSRNHQADPIINESLSALNQLTSLRHLHLCGNLPYKKVDLPEITNLSRLESFSLYNYFAETLSILEQLGEPLRKLSLRANIGFNEFEQFFVAKLEISSKLTHLSIKTCKENKEFFLFICANFPLLATFQFGSISSLKQDEAISSLAKLKNLTSLIVDEMWNEENSSITDNLKQIKTLQVTINDYILETFPRIAFGSIFPNLETFTIFTNNYKLLNSARTYLTDGLNLKTCKVNCSLICQDDLIFMGTYREQYEEDEQSRWEDEEDDRHKRNNGYIRHNNV